MRPRDKGKRQALVPKGEKIRGLQSEEERKAQRGGVGKPVEAGGSLALDGSAPSYVNSRISSL